MIAKTLIILIVGLLFSSCSIRAIDNKKTSDSKKDPDTKVVTDFSVCEKGKAHLDPRGRWSQQLQTKQDGKEMLLDVKVVIDSSHFQAINTCTMENLSLTAEVIAKSMYDKKYIQILEKKEDEKHYDDGKTNFQCNISLEETKMEYSYKGSCLVLSSPGQDDMVLVPLAITSEF